MIAWVNNSFAETESTAQGSEATLTFMDSTNEIPPPEMLIGYRNDSNNLVRGEFYSRKASELVLSTTQKLLSREESIDMLVKEHDLLTLSDLGTDFPVDKLKKLSQIHRNMLEEKEKIKKQFKDGRISEKKCKILQAAIYEKWLRDHESVLNEEEFEIFFEFKKSEINNYSQAFLKDILSAVWDNK